MKNIITLCFLALTIYCQAQVKLEEHDLTNLIEISEIYSKSTSGFTKEITNKIDALKTPKLTSLVEALIASGKQDTSVLNIKHWN